ncbi:hypothetical protein RRG08_049844 [Elysia crispata]|uniref:Uncharacterized protein n=1 Tax=Elysia crispata TaxID=231223 RepID=A0AAE1DMU0_9GAST|nr:hypothetical protein RRG08_049844 [Elysia crispata]
MESNNDDGIASLQECVDPCESDFLTTLVINTSLVIVQIQVKVIMMNLPPVLAKREKGSPKNKTKSVSAMKKTVTMMCLYRLQETTFVPKKKGQYWKRRKRY